MEVLGLGLGGVAVVAGTFFLDLDLVRRVVGGIVVAATGMGRLLTRDSGQKNEWEKVIMLLMPITPHLAHECYEKKIKQIYWPKYNEKLLEEESCKIVIQIDGRKRGIMKIPIDSKEIIVIKKSKDIDNVSKHIENTAIKKNIYIKNKLVNFITKK